MARRHQYNALTWWIEDRAVLFGEARIARIVKPHFLVALIALLVRHLNFFSRSVLRR